jgi:biotin transport system substrate-specific component
MQKKFSVRDLSYISLFATLIAVSGYISVPLPFSTVPVTAQSLAVMMAGDLLPVRHAAASLIVFLMLGAAGLPVFSGGTAGLGIIVGKTGGYLIGFLVGAVFISILKGKRPSLVRLLCVNAVGGIVVVYIFGVLWMNFVTGIGLDKAVILGALPFIPGDIVKAVVSALLALRLSKHIKLSSD